jgi:hypothetical protein
MGDFPQTRPEYKAELGYQARSFNARPEELEGILGREHSWKCSRID